MSSTPQFKPICTQNDMRLGKNAEMKLFTLEYYYRNPNFNILSLININIHNLLYEANKDIIDTVEVQPHPTDPSEHNILYKFRDIGSDIGGDLGGLKTYMFVNIKIAKRFAGNGNTEIIFTSKSIPYDNHLELIRQKYKLLEYPLYIQKYIYQEDAAVSNIQVLHMFKLKPDQETEITVAMENAISILIKKMYFRLKVAIESLRQ